MRHAPSLSAEKALSLYQVDPLLPSQYFDTVGSRDRLEREKRLMLAVLEDAMLCFQKYALARSSKGKRLFREAEDWILAENSDRLCSFENICTVLGLDPNYIRRSLIREKEKLSTESPNSTRRRANKTTKKTSRKRKHRVAA